MEVNTALFIEEGPSSSLSGKPWPRLTELCSAANLDISSNIVVGRLPKTELKGVF